MQKLEKGFVHIYTGEGKGKTTSALGLSVRAVCAGLKVYFAQFLKGQETSELCLVSNFATDAFTIRQFGTEHFVIGKPSQRDIEVARYGFEEILKITKSSQYDLIVLDEFNTALHFELIPIQQAIDLIRNKNPKTELVITGRNAPKELLDIADLVTEMREIKHYFKTGVFARKGIEY